MFENVQDIVPMAEPAWLETPDGRCRVHIAALGPDGCILQLGGGLCPLTGAAASLVPMPGVAIAGHVTHAEADRLEIAFAAPVSVAVLRYLALQAAPPDGFGRILPPLSQADAARLR